MVKSDPMGPGADAPCFVRLGIGLLGQLDETAAACQEDRE
jgi:hypothetical protein